MFDHSPHMSPLQLHDLSLESGGQKLIEGLNLTLPAQGCTVIMGPNGAGKSLLLKLLHGLSDPTAGRIDWGTSVPRQAMLFQTPVLLRRTVAANVDFALKVRGNANPARRDALLAQVGLADRNTAPARRLSGGERQRLALARALATDPQVLFLDEPTASLDPASVVLIEGIVKSLVAQGTKVIFVTHDAAQARRLAHDVVFMHQGQLVEHTSAAAFFPTPTSPLARDYLAGRILI